MTPCLLTLALALLPTALVCWWLGRHAGEAAGKKQRDAWWQPRWNKEREEVVRLTRELRKGK